MQKVERSNFRNILLVSGTIIVIMFAIGGYVWLQVPPGEEVCTHWNAAGQCDDYGSKFMGILLMPIIAIGLVALLAVLPRIEPRANHLAQSHKAYVAVWAVTLLFLLGVYVISMLDILGYNTSATMTNVMPFLLGILFIVIGNYLGKVRSNFFFGIRTPWTLSSELAWNKTHRLGGKLFIGLGLLCMVTSFLLSSEIWVYFWVGSVIAVTLFLFGYSYAIWKEDAANTACNRSSLV